MGILLLFLYLISSILLFFLINYVESKDRDNYINKVLVSVVYIIFLAGIFSTYGLDNKNDNIFLIVIFEFIIRLLYTSYVLEKNFFRINKYWWMSLVGSYFVNYIFIRNVDNVFPSASEFRVVIWIFIFIYLYGYFKRYVTIRIDNDNWVYYKDRDYIVIKYAKFKNNYYNVVTTKYNVLKSLVYAIMVYENYHRSEILRRYDVFRFSLDNRQRKFGIMQVVSKNMLSDSESIRLSIKRLEKIYLKLTKNKRDNNLVKGILKDYYKDNIIVDEVMNIYDEIRLFDYR